MPRYSAPVSYTLIQQAPVEQQVAGRTAWSVTVTVRSSNELAWPSKIFVFQAEDPADPLTRGWFTAVASPAQLQEYPEDAPVIDSGADQQPYYRLDSVEIVTRNPDDITALVEQIYEEADLLYLNLKAMNNLAEATILLPVCRSRDDVWPGSSLLGPWLDAGAQPAWPVVRAIVEFTNADGLVTFDSEAGADGSVLIVNGETWTFQIPPQPLHLSIGTWNWELIATDSQGNSVTCFTGAIPSQY